jgi:hypothetical protein
MEGGCTCRRIRYRLIGPPLIVHACHCRWCQRETGGAHALNALYEADRVVHTAGEPKIVVTPSASGKGQKSSAHTGEGTADVAGCIFFAALHESAYGSTKRTSKMRPLMSAYRGSAKLDCFAPLAMTTGFAWP